MASEEARMGRDERVRRPGRQESGHARDDGRFQAARTRQHTLDDGVARPRRRPRADRRRGRRDIEVSRRRRPSRVLAGLRGRRALEPCGHACRCQVGWTATPIFASRWRRRSVIPTPMKMKKNIVICVRWR